MPPHRLLLLVLMVAGAALPRFATAREDPDRPNIVLIMADDLGYRDLACYGSKRNRTPNLDRLFASGMHLTQHYAGAPVCAPSRAVLMTGRSLYRSGIRDNSEVLPEGQSPLPADEITIAEALKEAGYTTGIWGKWGLGPMDSEGSPSAQGFDRFFGYNCQRVAHSYYPPYLYDNEQQIALNNDIPRKIRLEQPPADWDSVKGNDYAPQLIADDLIDWIRRKGARDQPFFAYYATIIPHLALQAPDEWVDLFPAERDEGKPYLGQKGYSATKRPRASYAAQIAFLDHQVGRIVQALREAGQLGNTLILFTSDNGGTFDLGGFDPAFFEPTGELRAAKGQTFEGGIRVPLIAFWPGKIESGTRSERISAHQDILPTVCDVAGIDTPEASDGISFLPLLTGQGEQEEHAWLFWEFPGYGGQQAVRMGQWKAVRRNLHRKADAPIALFDLSTDPAENRNVAADHPEVVEQIRAIIDENRQPHPKWPLRAIDGR